jgi:hypothetical protein
MWIKAEDAHMKLVNLANANELVISYTGLARYRVVAEMIGGTSILIKQCPTELEATVFLEELYQQLL